MNNTMKAVREKTSPEIFPDQRYYCEYYGYTTANRRRRFQFRIEYGNDKQPRQPRDDEAGSQISSGFNRRFNA